MTSLYQTAKARVEEERRIRKNNEFIRELIEHAPGAAPAKLSRDATQEKIRFIRDVVAKQKLQKESSERITGLLKSLDDGPNGLNLTAEGKLVQLLNARDEVAYQFLSIDRGRVTDRFVTFVLSGEADELSAASYITSVTLIEDLDYRLSDLKEQKQFLQEKWDEATRDSDREKARFYSEELRSVALTKAETGATMDDVARKIATSVAGAAANNASSLILDEAGVALRSEGIAEDVKGLIQDAMLTLAGKTLPGELPLTAFTTGKVIVETTDHDPKRQAKGVQMMFDGLKAYQAAGHDAGDMLEAYIAPTSFPIKNAVVRQFIDDQLKAYSRLNRLCRVFGWEQMPQSIPAAANKLREENAANAKAAPACEPK